ncbi:MAG TPA: hypothetical protein VD927_16900 [Chryseosolibacter sp.]|nr:hypothetical protein [Chryseosolibacter sp.]
MSDPRIISNYSELLLEKKHLEQSIHKQKSIIRHNVDEFKLDFEKEIQPALAASKVITQIFETSSQQQQLLRMALTTVTHFTIRLLFRKSNILFTTVLPVIISTIVSRFTSKSAKSSLHL